VITIYNGQAVVNNSRLNHILIKIPILLYISVIIAIIFVQLISAESIPKIGKTCPQGYHIDGFSGYRIPFDVKNAPHMLPKIGKTCPTGYHIDGTS